LNLSYLTVIPISWVPEKSHGMTIG